MTPYRTYPSSEVKGNIRVCEGVKGLVADTTSLHNMVLTTGQKLRPDGLKQEDITVRYHVNPSEFLLAQDRMMCQWRLQLSFGTSNNVAKAHEINLYVASRRVISCHVASRRIT